MKNNKFINTITNSSLFWMILSLLISLFMWTYLESKEIKQTEKVFEGIKVEFRGLKEDLYILEPSPGTVDFTVTGPSRLVSQLQSEDLTAVVDVTGLSPQVYNKKCSIVLPDSFSSDEKAELHISFTVNNIFTESNVIFRISKRVTQTVSINASFQGELLDQCYIGTVDVEPKQIELTGPEYYLDNVAYALLVFGEAEEIDRSFDKDSLVETFDLSSENTGDVVSYQLVLKTVKGEDYNNNSISYGSEHTVTVPVYRKAKFALALDDSSVKYGAGAEKDNTSFRLDPSEIELTGIPAEIEQMDKTIYITPKIDTRTITELDESQENYVFERSVRIPIPEGLTSRSDISEATLTVTISGLTSKDFVVRNIRVVNLPEGYEAEVITESLTVTLRGPSELIEALKADDIYAEIDLSKKYPGKTPIRTPEIKLTDDLNPCGAVGKIDPVSIVLHEIDESED